MKTKQSGVTLIGFLFILMIVAFFAYMALKLFPSYSEFFGIEKAMKQLSTEGVDGKSQDSVRRDFMYKLSFQYADDVIKPQDIDFISHDGGTDMRVSYDKRIHFIYNIDFLVHFDKTVALNGSLN